MPTGLAYWFFNLLAAAFRFDHFQHCRLSLLIDAMPLMMMLMIIVDCCHLFADLLRRPPCHTPCRHAAIRLYTTPSLMPTLMASDAIILRLIITPWFRHHRYWCFLMMPRCLRHAPITDAWCHAILIDILRLRHAANITPDIWLIIIYWLSFHATPTIADWIHWCLSLLPCHWLMLILPRLPPSLSAYAFLCHYATFVDTTLFDDIRRHQFISLSFSFTTDARMFTFHFFQGIPGASLPHVNIAINAVDNNYFRIYSRILICFNYVTFPRFLPPPLVVSLLPSFSKLSLADDTLMLEGFHLSILPNSLVEFFWAYQFHCFHVAIDNTSLEVSITYYFTPYFPSYFLSGSSRHCWSRQ